MKDFSLHLLDIIQNSVVAKATQINISLGIDKLKEYLTVVIWDNGCGMDGEMLKNVTSPFTTSRTSRKVGLGIPLYQESALRAEGNFEIKSELNKGTTVMASFKVSNIDRLPLGDIADTLITVIMGKPDIDIILALNYCDTSFVFDTKEIKDKLGEVPITAFEVIGWIKEFINEGIISTFGGVLDEVSS